MSPGLHYDITLLIVQTIETGLTVPEFYSANQNSKTTVDIKYMKYKICSRVEFLLNISTHDVFFYDNSKAI